MNNIIVRECQDNDLDDIQALQHKWEKEDITLGFSAAEKEYLKSKLGQYFLVTEMNDVIVGFAYGTIHKANNMSIFNNGEFYIEVDDLYVCKHYRNKGIGNCLMKKLLIVAKDNGIERSLVYSSTKEMDRVVKFYRKHGYKSWNIQMYK